MCCICVSCSCSDLILACEPVTPNGCLLVLFCLIFCELDSHIKSISSSRFFHSGNISKLEKIAAFVSLRLDVCNAWRKSPTFTLSLMGTTSSQIFLISFYIQ